jgi:hypothetical protein
LYVKHDYNNGTTLWGGGKGKENDRVNNIEMHYICEGRGYSKVHRKLLNNGGWEVKGKEEYWKGSN